MSDPDKMPPVHIAVGFGLAGLFLGSAAVLIARSIFGGADSDTKIGPAPDRPVAHRSVVTAGSTLIVATPRNMPGRLRSGASKDTSSVALVPHGEAVLVLGSATDARGDTWYRVRTLADKEGYMHSDILAPKGGAS